MVHQHDNRLAAMNGEYPRRKAVEFDFIDSATFAHTDYSRRFLINGVLVEGEPAIVGGPQKSMKSSLLLEMGISIATGKPLLDYFNIEEAATVMMMSAESGMATLQETAWRICRSKSIDLASTNIHWCSSVPQFGSSEHVFALEEALIEFAAQVLVVDPLYFCLGDVEASNLIAVGERLRPVAEVCRNAGVTLIIAHHTKKNSSTTYEPLELSDLSWAGIQEFARQWLLLSRREKYQPGTGDHKLWLSVGGSAGHSGLFGVDIEEGVWSPHSERFWKCEVKKATEAFNAEQQQRKAKNEQKEREHQQTVAEAQNKILAALRLAPNKQLSRTATFDHAGLSRNAKYANEALSGLLISKQIVQCEVMAGNRKHDGYELNEEANTDDSRSDK